MSKLTSAVAAARSIVSGKSDAERLAEARAEMATLTGPPNRDDLLQLFDGALSRNAAKIERELRRTIEAFRVPDQHTLADRLQGELDIEVLRLILRNFGRTPVETLAHVLAPALLDAFRTMIRRVDYIGADSPPLAGRFERRVKLHREIVALERAMRVEPPPSSSSLQISRSAS